MSRSENDLRDALNELDRRAVEHGAPSTDEIMHRTTTGGHGGAATGRHVPRWLPPLAAAAVVAAAGVTAAVVATDHTGPAPRPTRGAAGGPSGASASPSASALPSTSASGSEQPLPGPSSTGTTGASSSAVPNPGGPSASAAAVLADAANRLAAMPSSPVPAADEFYYRKTSDATSWTSVSGRRPGETRSSSGSSAVPGCRHGMIVGSGISGTCTLDDVPHYRGDAPTTPSAWDAYLEQIAPGSKAGNAQGKIIVGVLHEDLISTTASAALLRYTESCPGLSLVKTAPVSGEHLVGVTCTSMTYGSYALAFARSSHALVGFVPVDYETGKQQGSAEIVRQTAIVKAVGDRP